MKDTILFFDRCELTYLYGKITPYLKDVRVVHVAYSQIEASILKAINIQVDYIFLDVYRDFYDQYVENINLLSEIDADIIKYSRGRFNLNSSIQSDRTFVMLTYEECLKSAASYYLTWKKIFANLHVDVFMHEPCSLFFNHIASILCNKQGGTYTYQIQVPGETTGYFYLFSNNDNFSSKELEDKYYYYVQHTEAIDRKRCATFLEKFRKERTVFFGNIKNSRQSILNLYSKAIKAALIKHLRRKEEDKKYNITDYWLISQNSSLVKIRNICGYKKQHIQFLENIPKGEKYFFYPMHLEPEAVVLYLADGIYKNQVKLIENIAASLPPGYYLYVKDHPHEYAYRSAEDYKRLMQIPNIRLLSPSISGKELIHNCMGVVTINGSAGYEGLLLGKQVYCFGKNHYSFHPHVNYIENIRDFRGIVYNNMNINYTDDDSIYAYVMAFLESQHPGYTSYFLGNAEKVGFDQEENAKLIAKDITNYVTYLKSC